MYRLDKYRLKVEVKLSPGFYILQNESSSGKCVLFQVWVHLNLSYLSNLRLLPQIYLLPSFQKAHRRLTLQRETKREKFYYEQPCICTDPFNTDICFEQSIIDKALKYVKEYPILPFLITCLQQCSKETFLSSNK